MMKEIETYFPMTKCRHRNKQVMAFYFRCKREEEEEKPENCVARMNETQRSERMQKKTMENPPYVYVLYLL